MDVATVKQMAQTGDVVLVHGSTVEQVGIEVATASSLCHVGQLLRMPNGELIVAEMLEPHGYQSMSFDDWLTSRPSDDVYYGTAPELVRQGAGAILSRQSVYAEAANRKYDFSALPLVWLSQITGKEYATNGEVCSLLVGDDWEATGYPVPGNPAPGSFLKLCESVSFIRR